MNSFYASLTTHLDGVNVVGSLTLPEPIEAAKYEIAFVECSFTPSWLTYNQLWLKYETSTNSETVLFASLPFLEPNHAISIIRTELSSKFGESMTTAPVKITFENGNFYLSVRRATTIHMSNGLSELFGVEATLKNDAATVQKHLISPMSTRSNGNELYVLSCDEMAVNGISNNGPLKALQFIHTYDGYSTDTIVDRSMSEKYYALEGNLLSSLTFRLYKKSGHPIFLNQSSTFFNIIVHIRRK
jgi:hypothetical protein